MNKSLNNYTSDDWKWIKLIHEWKWIQEWNEYRNDTKWRHENEYRNEMDTGMKLNAAVMEMKAQINV